MKTQTRLLAIAVIGLMPFSAFAAKAPLSAHAEIINEKGEKIGQANLRETKTGLSITLQVEKLSPGSHGLHFHEKGQCDAPDFKSAGAHFNPEGKAHGTKNPKGHHLGDLHNLEVDAKGQAKITFTASAVNLKKGDPHSLLKPQGTSLVIHEKSDDEMTDPSGNSGNRIACGVIQAGK